MAFRQPHRTLAVTSIEQVRPAILEAEAEVAQGRWAVVVLAYEAAPAFDSALVAQDADPHGPPLAWIGLFDAPSSATTPPAAAPFQPLDWQPNLTRRQYQDALHEIRRHIAAGDTYQVNYTFALESSFESDPWQLFAALTRSQGGRFGAYVDLGRHVVCSASPELFFHLEDGRLIARPMKGTSRRGQDSATDHEQRKTLHSEKNHAENLMIVDMIRNDLGRVAEPGSVQVSRLFHAETYPTVHQLVSEVRAQTSASVSEVLAALFPCASITGAPKIATSRIIRRLEVAPRGVYTGAIGYLSPRGESRFDVAIRTAVVDRHRQSVRYGTGGGIVWDSDPLAEYDECRSKALVLVDHRPAFELLETLLWRPRRGFYLLDLHLRRLLASAAYFGFPASRKRLISALETFVRQRQDEWQAVRLKLDESGEATVEAGPQVQRERATWRLRLDDRPVDSNHIFLFHKTTQRQIYDQAIRRHPDADDVLLWNQDGELTESTRANLLLRRGDRWLTPPVRSGLLAGVLRAALLQRGRIEEHVLSQELLTDADEILLINSVRGLIRAELLPRAAACPPSPSPRAVEDGFKATGWVR